METPAVLDDMGKSLVLRKVAAARKKNLRLFGSHLEQSGFIGELKSMLSELFQYGISGETIREMADSADSAMLRQKLSDMSELYEGFRGVHQGAVYCPGGDFRHSLPRAPQVPVNQGKRGDSRRIYGIYSCTVPAFRASFNLLPPGGCDSDDAS